MNLNEIAPRLVGEFAYDCLSKFQMCNWVRAFSNVDRLWWVMSHKRHVFLLPWMEGYYSGWYDPPLNQIPISYPGYEMWQIVFLGPSDGFERTRLMSNRNSNKNTSEINDEDHRTFTSNWGLNGSSWTLGCLVNDRIYSESCKLGRRLRTDISKFNLISFVKHQTTDEILLESFSLIQCSLTQNSGNLL